MKQRPKAKRPNDPNMRMHSIMREVITISEKPIKSPNAPVMQKRKK